MQSSTSLSKPVTTAGERMAGCKRLFTGILLPEALLALILLLGAAWLERAFPIPPDTPTALWGRLLL